MTTRQDDQIRWPSTRLKTEQSLRYLAALLPQPKAEIHGSGSKRAYALRVKTPHRLTAGLDQMHGIALRRKRCALLVAVD